MLFETHPDQLPFAQEYVLFSLVGFKGNLSLLDIFYFFLFPRGRKKTHGSHRGLKIPSERAAASGGSIRGIRGLGAAPAAGGGLRAHLAAHGGGGGERDGSGRRAWRCLAARGRRPNKLCVFFSWGGSSPPRCNIYVYM